MPFFRFYYVLLVTRVGRTVNFELCCLFSKLDDKARNRGAKMKFWDSSKDTLVMFIIHVVLVSSFLTLDIRCYLF